jgi:hypothetical protein
MAISQTVDLRDNDGPSNSMLGKFYCRMSIGEYKRPKPFETATFNPTSSIYLPLPDILRDTSDIKYNSTDSQTVGDFFNGDAVTGILGFGYRNLGRMASSAITNGGGAIAGALMAATGPRGAAMSGRFGTFAGDTLAEMFPAENLQTAFQQTIGTAPNPNPSIAFEGPSLRSFNLNWTFFPTSKAESDNVFKIIKLLKQTALPAQTFSGSGAILNYPYMCQLNFFPWDNSKFGDSGINRWGWTENSIMRFKKCMMTNVDVDYNPSNVPGFFNDDNSSPVAIRVSISFQEIEYMLSDDWDSGLKGNVIIDAAAIGAVTSLISGGGPTSIVAGIVATGLTMKAGALEATGTTTQ